MTTLIKVVSLTLLVVQLVAAYGNGDRREFRSGYSTSSRQRQAPKNGYGGQREVSSRLVNQDDDEALVEDSLQDEEPLSAPLRDQEDDEFSADPDEVVVDNNESPERAEVRGYGRSLKIKANGYGSQRNGNQRNGYSGGQQKAGAQQVREEVDEQPIDQRANQYKRGAQRNGYQSQSQYDSDDSAALAEEEPTQQISTSYGNGRSSRTSTNYPNNGNQPSRQRATSTNGYGPSRQSGAVSSGNGYGSARTRSTSSTANGYRSSGQRSRPTNGYSSSRPSDLPLTRGNIANGNGYASSAGKQSISGNGNGKSRLRGYESGQRSGSLGSNGANGNRAYGSSGQSQRASNGYSSATSGGQRATNGYSSATSGGQRATNGYSSASRTNANRGYASGPAAPVVSNGNQGQSRYGKESAQRQSNGDAGNKRYGSQASRSTYGSSGDDAGLPQSAANGNGYSTASSPSSRPSQQRDYGSGAAPVASRNGALRQRIVSQY